MAANERQVEGNHYKTSIEHWDWVYANDLDYFQGQITKYIFRWKKKNGLKDLQKAQHFLEKYIELTKSDIVKAEAKEGALEKTTEYLNDR